MRQRREQPDAAEAAGPVQRLVALLHPAQSEPAGSAVPSAASVSPDRKRTRFSGFIGLAK